MALFTVPYAHSAQCPIWPPPHSQCPRRSASGNKEQKITTIITILENYGIEPHYTKLIRQLLEVAGEDRLVIKATRFGGAHTFSEAKSGSGFMDREPSLFMERQASSMLASLGNKRHALCLRRVLVCPCVCMCLLLGPGVGVP